MTIRRRSAWWLRELSSQSLHRIGGKLYNQGLERELTSGEEHLWTMVVSELEYRARKITPADRCTCLLCCDPFALFEVDVTSVTPPGQDEPDS